MQDEGISEPTIFWYVTPCSLVTSSFLKMDARDSSEPKHTTLHPSHGPQNLTLQRTARALEAHQHYGWIHAASSPGLLHSTSAGVILLHLLVIIRPIPRLQIWTPLCNFRLNLVTPGGTRWRSWLRHCATSRKVAGSIPDGVIGILHWHNPSGRTVALGSTQPPTQMSTRNIPWG